jgi:hypothetical protein
MDESSKKCKNCKKSYGLVKVSSILTILFMTLKETAISMPNSIAPNPSFQKRGIPPFSKGRQEGFKSVSKQL